MNEFERTFRRHCNELGIRAAVGLTNENTETEQWRNRLIVNRARQAEPATTSKPRNRRPRIFPGLILMVAICLAASSCTYAQLAQVNAGEQRVAWEHTAAGRGDTELVFCATSSDPSTEVILQWVPAWVLARSNCADQEWIGANNVMVQRIAVPPATITYQVP